MTIGFSTGSLALGDVRRGMRMAEQSDASAIELSALREDELEPLINQIEQLDVSRYSYVSLHAPSRLKQLTEKHVVSLLQRAASRGWMIVMHPDAISDFDEWKKLGDRLCLENMDKRKGSGRTAKELVGYFDRLPNARFCFDIGHARQVDPSMLEARSMLRAFRDRLCEIHMSYVNSTSRHEALNFEAMAAFRRVAGMIAAQTPVILETPVDEQEMPRQMAMAESFLEYAKHSTEQTERSCQE